MEGNNKGSDVRSRHGYARTWRGCLALMLGGLMTTEAQVAITLTETQGIVTSSGFKSFSITSSFEDLGVSESYRWKFTYEIEVTQSRNGGPWDISHLILQVSDNFTSSDLKESALWEGPKTYGAAPSNPGIPGNVFGIKLDPGESNAGKYVITLHSTRIPMLGDFYAKQANRDYAYNAGFGLDPALHPESKIWVPDTRVDVPEPHEYAIIVGLGLVGFAIHRRRRA